MNSKQLDQLNEAVVYALRAVAQYADEAAAIRHALEEERWVRADEIAERFGVTRRWVYHHQARLGAVSRGRRTLVFPLSRVIAELGAMPRTGTDA